MPRRIYTVEVIPKGDTTPAMTWEGQAFCLIDAFHSARQAWKPMVHHGASEVRCIGRRYEA